MLEPLPTGAWAFLAVTIAVFTGTLPFQAAFSAFSNDVIWLIVVSFFFAAVRIPMLCTADSRLHSVWASALHMSLNPCIWHVCMQQPYGSCVCSMRGPSNRSGVQPFQ